MKTLKYLAFVIAVGHLGPAAAQDTAKIDDYYGSFVGSAITRNAGQGAYVVRDRDIDVSIEAAANGGFVLTSVVNARRGFMGRRVKRSRHSLAFVPGDRSNMWRARTSKPLAEGGPTILARLDKRGLRVYIAAFEKDGSLHTAVYSRRFIRAGQMELRYHRSVDGRTVRSVFGTLMRKKK